eukprot:CAMPEP_0117020442 /NCGR_PEP_ID=MMETSP0472-20121206/15545_1 /TAXON_ID=693140 ORGANISM="Tiarina fusus, Strain LIS" /NCGR_SAMPLE_ID=MMETSP0472 /ASSEMBLY_ACC=CAM_ASM_000603 /LENGTH=439 /DNA_ID=CAMNT_0004725661 /DNA_START=229 /DNA_END=1548 /DNA_ORIENTATION=+
MPYGSGPTLSAVKQHCAAAHSLSHLGPEGYHWRVLVEEKAGASGEKGFSWWDIQDGNAKLPVKETSQNDLRKLLFPSKPSSASALDATKAAKGAFKMMGKMASAVAGDDTAESHGPPVSVLMFKLLDLVKIHDDFNRKHGGAPVPAPSAPRRPRAPAPRPAPQPRVQQPTRHQPPPQRAPPPQQRAQAQPARRAPPPAPRQEASLMDFGAPPAAPVTGNNPKVLHHAMSSPAAINPNETRAERLKREQAKKQQNMEKVWDDVDQRWVVKEDKPPAAASGPPKAKAVGIKLDGSSAVGKSANVQAAVSKRVNEMKESQAKALQEVREREAKKKREEEEEDIVRKQLEPKIKQWSEEHGKKKQLRALLGTLHTVLWPGAKWKTLSIGDILDDSKVKRAFHKATLVVHPDKTHHLPPDQRFLAKRIFDALCQAKTDFDNGTN